MTSTAQSSSPTQLRGNIGDEQESLYTIETVMLPVKGVRKTVASEYFKGNISVSFQID